LTVREALRKGVDMAVSAMFYANYYFYFSSPKVREIRVA